METIPEVPLYTKNFNEGTKGKMTNFEQTIFCLLGLSCQLIDTTRDSVLTISNCLEASQGSGFGPDGLGRARTDHISIKEQGLYRIAFSGDIETSSSTIRGPTMISLEKGVS